MLTWDLPLPPLSPPPPPLRSFRAQKLTADMKKKAVLLSGPPGIGKTTSALIVCRELGFEPVEVSQHLSREGGPTLAGTEF